MVSKCYADGMARDEADREDLLVEATALVERIELAPVQPSDATGVVLDMAEADDRIVAGFRTGGALSIFFGGDFVFQFNAAGELRRAYVSGRLFKAVRGRMVSLERQRAENVVQLYSRALTESDQAEFIEAMQARLRLLCADIEAGRMRVIGQVPADGDVLDRLRHWLVSHHGTTIARSPRV
jgi:hypothetical protein